MKEGWEVKRLGDVSDVSSGNSAPQDRLLFKDGRFPFFRTSDLGKMHISKDMCYSSDYLNNEGIKGLRLFKKGTILFPKSGASTYLNHRVVMGVDGFVSSHLATIYCDSQKVDGIFVFYYLTTIDAKSISAETAYPTLSVKQISNLYIPVPTLPEQQRIVKTLDEAFAAIAKAKENAEKNLQNAREIFQSYLQSVFANPGDGWEEKKLGEVYDVRDGTHDSPKFHKSGFALITSKNLKNDLLNYDNVQYISEDDYKKINQRSKVDKGDILFAMIGTIGNPVVIENEPDFAIKNVALFKIPKEQCSYFLKYYLDSKVVIDKMAREAKGTTQKFVGLGYLRNFKIMLPNINEQRTIVEKLNTLSAETKKLEAIYNQKLIDLEEMKKSILEKAFSGELT